MSRRRRAHPALSESAWLTGTAPAAGLDAWLAGALAGPPKVRPDVLAGVLALAAAGAAAGSGVRPALARAATISPAHGRFAAGLDAALASGAAPAGALAAARAPAALVALFAAAPAPAPAWAAVASLAELRSDVFAARARATRVVFVALSSAVALLVAALWLTPPVAPWDRVVLGTLALALVAARATQALGVAVPAVSRFTGSLAARVPIWSRVALGLDGCALAAWVQLRASAGLDAGTPAQLGALVATPAARSRVLAAGPDAFADIAAARVAAAIAGGGVGPLTAACSRAQAATRADADALAGTLAPFAALAPLAAVLAWVLAALAA